MSSAPNSNTLEQRLEVLETKVSYQDYLIEQLNEVIIEQGSELDQLKSRIRVLEELTEGDPES